MKEISRIHIAKTAYDIEVDAKKDVEKYMNALERYADDAELLGDIEIRITELLTERGVAAGGVIAKDDVTAVRSQLGEPSDFIPEGAGDIAVGASELEGPTRKLYRDREHAIAGGVLAGLAHFFGIDAVWTRLIFIVLLFASFGAAFIVYLILWFIVPPARTAAEKLRMNNRPVTLASIKQLNEDEETKSESAAPAVRRVLAYVFGVFATIGAVVALFITLFVGFGLTFGTSDNSPVADFAPGHEVWSTAAFALFVISGILLATLCALVAYGAFSRKFTKRLGTNIVAVVVAGLVSFGSGVGVVLYHNFQEGQSAYNSQKTSYVNLPGNFSSVKKLVVDTGAVNLDYGDVGTVHVEYRVSNKPRYELTAATSVKPVFSISDDSSSATVSIQLDENDRRNRYVQPQLIVYGPSLESIEVKSGSASYYASKTQEHIAASVESDSLELLGSYERVTATVNEGGALTASNASIATLDVTTHGGYATAGVVRELSVTQPEVCAARESDAWNAFDRVVVSAITGTVTYNGKTRDARTYETACATLIVGDESEYESTEGEQ